MSVFVCLWEKGGGGGPRESFDIIIVISRNIWYRTSEKR